MDRSQVVVTLKLPCGTYAERLVIAIQHWEREHGRVGKGANQAAFHAQMETHYRPKSAAPAKESVAKWFGGRVPGTPHISAFAATLGVRLEWLLSNDGEMTTANSDEGRTSGIDPHQRDARHPKTRRERVV